MSYKFDRRTFFLGITGAAGTLLVSSSALRAKDLASTAMPKRVLGKTKQAVSILGLGTAPMGHADIGPEAAVKAIHTALDQGITYIDTGRIYGNSESYISKVARDRREEMFLVTKVWANSARRAEQQLATSLKTLGVDHVDLCHVHSMGHRDPERVLADDGSLAYLLKARQRGLTRFVGATGHHKVSNFRSIVDTGELDVLMVALNFVDRCTYPFQEEILPIARKDGTAIVAMKVFGGRKAGPSGNFMENYNRPGPPQMPRGLLSDSLRYSLSLEGVATALTGVYGYQEVVENASWAKKFAPMGREEIVQIEEKGKEMARSWGPHLGLPD